MNNIFIIRHLFSVCDSGGTAGCGPSDSDRLGSTRIDSDGLRSGRVATDSDITTRMDEGFGSRLFQHEIIVCCFTRFVLLCIAHCAWYIWPKDLLYSDSDKGATRIKGRLGERSDSDRCADAHIRQCNMRYETQVAVSHIMRLHQVLPASTCHSNAYNII